MMPRVSRLAPSRSMMWRTVVVALLAQLVASGAPRVAHAQDSAAAGISRAGENRTVEGRILTPRAGGADAVEPAAVRGVMVTLHRVGRDSAGPLDSMRTTASGEYRFRYRTVGSDAVYFASVTYGGIAYFTAPFRTAVVQGEAAEITVFDTTSRVFPLQVRGRHLIVGKIDSTDHRTVIEVFELENDSIRTLVAFDTLEQSATWSISVPQTARDIRINDGEVSADAFVHRNGRAFFFAPFAPGLKQLSFSYRIPVGDFPISYTTEQPIGVFEVLLEESSGTIVNDALTMVGNVNLEGRNFRRFLAQDLPAGERVIVELPSSRPLSGNLYIASLLIVIGAAMLLVLMRSMSRRTAATATTRPAISVLDDAGAVPHERLAREIAMLDDVFARNANPSNEVREAYERRRAELRDALAAALAGSDATR